MYDEGNDFKEDFFYLNKIIFKITGIWLPGKHIPAPQRILYFIYIAIFYGTTTIFLLCEFLIFREMLNEVDKFASYIGMVFTHIVGIFKWYTLVFLHSRVTKMMLALQDPRYRYESLNDFQPKLLFLKGKKINSICTVAFFVLYLFVGVSAHISSLIKINQIPEDPLAERNMTCADFLPYYFYTPFKATTKQECGYIFLYMDIGLDVHASLIACHDGVFVGLLNCLRIQMMILGGAFKTIRQRCLKQLKMPIDLHLLHEEENPELERATYEELKRCTKHLNLLLRTRDDIEHCFSYITLAQTLASLFILASCLYISSTIPATSPEFFSQLEYLICILTQLSLICYFGNEITAASDQIILSLYEGEWYSASAKFKRSMILTMCRMQRSVYISIGKFTPLTLATLVAVCRGSFSYFAVLKSF